MAALLVCGYHYQNGLSWIVGYVPFWGIFEFGRSGVDFFFVLSGFIIFLVHAEDIDRAHRLPRYAWRRVGRIYPAYWLATCVFMLLIFASGAGAKLLDPDWLLRSFLLAPQARPPILEIGWSLHHEMVFYALFAILIVRRVLGIALFALWLAAILFTCVTTPAGVGPMNFISPFDLQFFFGMAAAYIVRKGRVPAALPIAILGVILFAIVAGWKSPALSPPPMSPGACSTALRAC